MDKFDRILRAMEEDNLFADRELRERNTAHARIINLEDLYADRAETRNQALDDWLAELDDMFGRDTWRRTDVWESEQYVFGGSPLAWYQPITYYRQDAGIYLTDFGIWLYTRKIQDWQPTPQLFAWSYPTSMCVAAAIELLISHEVFHHDVEWFAIRQNATHSSRVLYDEYNQKIYNSGAPLEEALSTAEMQFAFMGKRGAQFPGDACAHVISMLYDELPTLAPGYNQADAYLTRRRNSLGRRELAASINQLTRTPNLKTSVPAFSIGKGSLADYFRHNVLLVPANGATAAAAPTSVFPFSVPSKDIKRLLKKTGYFESNLGAGSHSVWQHPSLPAVTLPDRREFEGYQVLRNIRDSLGLESFEELKVQAAKA